MKKIFSLLIVSTLTISSYAQDLSPTTLKQLTESIDRVPKYQGHLNDFEKIFSSEQATTLKTILSKIQENTGIDVSFITLDSTYITSELAAPFANGLESKWERDSSIKENNLMILLSKSTRVFHMNGNGLDMSNKISQEEINDIGQYFAPELKKHNFYQGTLDGLNGLLQFFEQKKSTKS